MGYVPGANSGDGTDGTFPTSGASQDSIYGLSDKMAVVPVAINFKQMPAGQSGPPGLQIVPWESALALLRKMSPDERSQIQQQLYAARLYPESYYGKNPPIIVPGELDPGTVKAWENAVEEAVQSSTYDQTRKSILNPKTVSDVINERIQLNQKAGLGTSGAAQPSVRLTNPTDLRQMAQAVGQKFLGRKPDPGFVDNYVAAYHAAEVASAQADAKGNTTAAPDPQAFAEQMLRQQYPVDVGVNDALNVGNQLVNTLSRPAGSLGLPTSGGVNG